MPHLKGGEFTGWFRFEGFGINNRFLHRRGNFLEKSIDLLRLPLDNDLDPPIRQIPHKSRYIELPRNVGRRESEPDTLHTSDIINQLANGDRLVSLHSNSFGRLRKFLPPFSS